MKLTLFSKGLFITFALVASCVAGEVRPLSEVAKEFEQFLPRGRIVTGELSGEKKRFSSVGDAKPIEIHPEKVLFEIGSTTKVFNGLLLAQAVVDGRVSLDYTLQKLLPAQKFSDPRVGNITLLQLANHTSGLPASPDDILDGCDPDDPFAHYDRARLLAWLGRVQLEGKAPFAIQYSNFGSGLLGDILSQVYKKDWAVLIMEKVTVPLGLDDTVVRMNLEQQRRFAPAHCGEDLARPFTFSALAGAGGLKSTASDMIRFGRALLEPEKTPLEKAIRLLLKPQNKEETMGLAIAFYSSHGQRACGHDGGTHGFRCVFEVLHEQKEVRIILINNSLLEGRVLIAKSHGKKTRYDLPERKITQKEMAEYEGTYKISENRHVKAGQFSIVRREERLLGQLEGTPSREPFLHLHPHSKPDIFFLRDVDAQYQFHREGGRVTSLTFVQRGVRLHAERTDLREQNGADQPATAPESRPAGNQKPKPESEGRSQ